MRLRVGLLVSILAFPGIARAQQPSAADKAAADLLFNEAEKLVEAGRVAQACPKFFESQRLDPQLGTLLHLADCYERNGQTASAWASFREATEIAAQRGDQREQVARDRAAALEPKLVKLTIVVPEESDVPGLEIDRDGQRVARVLWSTAVPVDPGNHTIVARAEGRQTWKVVVRAAEGGKTFQVAIPVLAPAPVAAPAPPPAPVAAQKPPAADRPKGGGSGLKTVGWVATGLGAAGLVAGGVLAGITAMKSSEADKICPTSQNCTLAEVSQYNRVYGDAENAQTGSTIAFVAGGVLLVAGIVMVAFAPSSKTAASLANLRASATKTTWGFEW